MKLTKTLSLFTVLCLLLGCVALAASGEGGASGGMSSTTLVRISGGSMSVNEGDGYTLDGELGIDAKDVQGIRFVAGSASQSFMSVSNSTHVDPLTSGFTAVLGGDESLYPMPSFAELYSNDGLNPNCEGYELDYGWISQLDAESGTLSAVTVPGQRLFNELLAAHSDGFNVYIAGGGTEDERVNRGPTQVSVSGGAALLVENAYIHSEGLEGMAIANNGSSGVGSTLVVKDSLFTTRGYVPASQNVSENLPNDPLLVTGADRTSLSGGESVTYYYDSAVVTDGWASLSTDSASGEGVDLVGVNTFASALLGGYGTYADGNCRDYFYGSVLEGAEIGVIIAGTGEVSLFDGDEGAEGGTGYRVGKDGSLAPYAFADDEEETERYEKLGGSAVAGGRWGVLIHAAGFAAVEPQGVLYAKDSSIITDRALYSDEDTEYSVNASWYGRELSPNIQKYIEYTEGADILIRSTNAQIVLDGVTLESYSGVLVHSVLNNDTSTPETPAGSNAAGTSVYMVDMEAEGDILDEDYERVMNITLDSTDLTGRIVSGTCAEWTGKWLAKGYAEDYTVGLASNTFGAEAPLDAFVHALQIDGDEVRYTPYGDDQGTTISLLNGASWTVTGESRLTSLTIDSRSELHGVLTVNGVQTEVAPGTYEGEIIIRPLTASGEMAA